MRILMINKFLYHCGGSETYMFKLGKFLESQGHEVQYFGMQDDRNQAGNGIGVYTSCVNFHSSNILAMLTYPVKTIYSKEARKQIKKVLEDFKPDICHLNNFTYQLTPSVILEIHKWRSTTARHCKIIFTAHDHTLICPNHTCYNPVTHKNCEKCLGGHFANCIKGKCIHGSVAKSIVGSMEGYYWKHRTAYQYIDKIICCSRFLKSKMDTNPIFADKTVVLHNFVEKVDWKNTTKKNYVLYFGRFSEEKGVSTLMQVCESLPDIPFVFAGTGSLENRINNISNIKNVGYQSGEALEQLIREANFSVCPSECYENCPFSVMESQMYGTPVLGANIGGIPELIQDGQTGELFKPQDKNDLRTKIRRLWENTEQISRYSKNCQSLCFDTIDEYYRKLMALYVS